MKKLLLVGVGSALMFTMGGVGPAAADGGPHRSTVVGAGAFALTATTAGGTRCASCHRAHTAKGENLLKQAQPALCYSCHSSLGSAVDVVDGVETSGVSPLDALRGGGFEYALIDGAGASKTMSTIPSSHGGYAIASEGVPVLQKETAVTSNHKIDGVAAGTMWGNGAVSAAVGTAADVGQTGVKLECGSCHDPHGNGNYRILRPVPVDAGTAQGIVTPAVPAAPAVLQIDPLTKLPVVPNVIVTPAKDYVPAVYAAVGDAGYKVGGINGVNIPDVPHYDATGKSISKNYTTNDYWSVADRQVPTVAGGLAPIAGQTDGYITNVAAWCTTCHTRYYAPSGSAGVSSGDATFTYRHASARTDKDGVSRPNCIQCHVSHGSNVLMTGKASSVPFPGQVGSNLDGTLSSADAGYSDSKLLRVNDRGTCVMCHNV